jgi:hypothetical protein
MFVIYLLIKPKILSRGWDGVSLLVALGGVPFLMMQRYPIPSLPPKEKIYRPIENNYPSAANAVYKGHPNK